MMIQIDDKIISTEIFDVKFCCDLSVCRGACCVEGNSGAPLEEEEIALLESEYESFRPYMKPSGIAAVESQGVAVIDDEGDLTTTLIDGGECAYVAERDGITYCAIEKAWLDGATAFRKPISCHLYPLRVAKFSNGTIGINYHRWDICDCALKMGSERGFPLYEILKEPIIRRFGESFFDTLAELAGELNGRAED